MDRFLIDEHLLCAKDAVIVARGDLLRDMRALSVIFSLHISVI